MILVSVLSEERRVRDFVVDMMRQLKFMDFSRDMEDKELCVNCGCSKYCHDFAAWTLIPRFVDGVLQFHMHPCVKLNGCPEWCKDFISEGGLL